MVGKDLSWSKGCTRLKVRGWRQRDQGGCGPGRGGQALGKRGTPTERPKDSALLATEGTENFLATLWPVSNPVRGSVGPGKRCPDSGARLSEEPPQKTSKAPIAGDREGRDRMRLAVGQLQ